MSKDRDDALAIAAAVGLAFTPRQHGRLYRAACVLCLQPILPGQGYRDTREGKIHGACAKEQEGGQGSR